MDKTTLKQICSRSEILHPFFRGIQRFESLGQQKYKLKKNGDFLVLNIADQHWFTIQRRNHCVYVFDSLSGLMLPEKSKMLATCKELLGGCSPRRLIYDFPHTPLQSSKSLTCGEHVIVYLLNNCYFLKHSLKTSIKKQKYAHSLLRFSKRHNITPDECVWREVYINLRLAKIPNMREVVEWYNKEIR